MDCDIRYLIRSINEAKDNIWLEDFPRAKEIVDSCLEKSGQAGILPLENTAEGIRERIYELRKIASRKRVKNRRSWVLASLCEELTKKENDPAKNLVGVCVINLIGLREFVGLLSEPHLQKTLNNIGNNQKEGRIVRKHKRGYRYSIERLADRWDVRAILDKSIQSLDPSKIREPADERSAFLEDRSVGLRSNIFELYGRDIYARIVGLGEYINVQIRAPRSEDEGGKVSKFVEELLDALIS